MIKKAELFNSVKIDVLARGIFITNKHVNFYCELPRNDMGDGVYFGGLQCHYPEGSEEYKNIEKWLVELCGVVLDYIKPTNEMMF